jgi:hypothetical protein
MTKFAAFAIYLCISVFILIIFPLMMHPTLPVKRKLIISFLAFFVLIPGGLTLYYWLGAPQMAF